MRHQKYLKISLACLFSLLLIFFLTPLFVKADSNYGVGNYSNCYYSLCNNQSITITSDGAVNLTLTFTGPNACVAGNDTVTVSTNAADGYTLFINSLNSGSFLSGVSNISPTTGTSSSPISLTANKWGYRVDGVAGFGSTPSNYLTASYAVVPYSTLDQIAYVNAAATNSATTVWYGVCANTSQPSGAYSDTIIYTAASNP